jgi:hypothetical protein
MRAMHMIPLAVMLSATAIFAAQEPKAAKDRGAEGARPPLTSEAAAVRTASQWIGLPDSPRPVVTIARVVVKGDRTPFLHDLIEGRTCYQVTFTGLTIRLPWGENDQEITSAIHGLTALVDARSGQVLRVRSVARLNAPSDRRTAAEVEGRISLLNEERWTGLPTAPPKVSLLKALYDREGRIATYMEQLDAYYVISVTGPTSVNEETGQVLGGPETRDTWQITLHRHVPFGPFSPAEQEKPLIYGWREVVDGQSGEHIESSNVY